MRVLAGALVPASFAAGQIGGNLRFNEVSIYRTDPMGVHMHDREFVELVGTPEQQLGTVIVLVIEGEGADAGVLERAWRIPAGRTMPADGMFVIGDAAVVERDLQFPNSGFIEEGTETFVLLRANNPPQVLALLNTDLDAENDGVLDTPLSMYGTVLDAFAMQTLDLDSKTYATPVLGRNVPGFVPGVFRTFSGAPGAAPLWSFGHYLNADQSLTTGNPPTPGALNSFGDATLFGIQHHALGAGRLHMGKPSAVLVNNLAIPDGVRMNLGTAQGWTGGIDAGTDGVPLPDGSEIRWDLRGVVNGQPDTLAATGRIVTQPDGRFFMYADASAMGATGTLVEIIEDGEVISSAQFGTTEPILYFRALNPFQFASLVALWRMLPAATQNGVRCTVAVRDILDEVIIQVPEEEGLIPASANIEVRITPVGATATLTAFNSFDFTGVNLPDLELSGQSIVQSDHPAHGRGPARLAGTGSETGMSVTDLDSLEEYGVRVGFEQAGSIGAIVVEPLGTEAGEERIRTIVRQSDGSPVAETGIGYSQGTFSLYGDYTLLQPSMLDVQGLLNGNIVVSTPVPGPILDPGDIIIIRRGCIWRPCQIAGPDHVATLEFDQDSMVQFGQLPPVLVDQVRVVARGIASDIMNGVIPAVEVFVTGYESFNVVRVIDSEILPFAGSTYTVTGAGQLTAIDDSTLALSVLGAPGCTLALDLGGGGSGLLDVLMPAANMLPADTEVQFRSYDQPNAPSENYAVSFTFRSDGTNYALEGDLSRLTGGPVWARLYDDDKVVLEQTIDPDDLPCLILGGWNSILCTVLPDDCFAAAGSHFSRFVFEGDVLVSGLSSPHMADSIVFEVENFVPAGTGVYHKEVSIANAPGPIPAILFGKHSIGKFGNYHRSLGEAQIAAIDNGVFSSQIGSSGLDGIRVDVQTDPGMTIAGIATNHIMNGVLIDWGSLNLSIRGRVEGGQQGEILTELRGRIDSINNGVVFARDDAETAFNVMFFQGDELVHAAPGQSGDLFRAAALWTGSRIMMDGKLHIHFPNGTLHSLLSTGKSYAADRVTITPQAPGPRIVELDSYALRFGTAAGAPAGSVLITSEEIIYVPPPPVCPCDFNMDAAINSQDFFDFLACFFSVPPCDLADYNADASVNSQDFFDFLACFFAPPSGCP